MLKIFHSINTARIVLVVLLALTVLGWYLAMQYVERRAAERFEFEVEGARGAILGRMLDYEQVLRGAVGLFDSSHHVSRAEWRIYITKLQIDEFFPGIQGIGVAFMIPPAIKAAHEQAVRAEGFPGYAIHPAGARDIYSSVVYLEPFAGRNLRAFGYDMFSEPVRHAAMERARDSGAAVVSGRVTLIQEIDKDVQAGFLMYLPVYRPGVPHDSVAQRRQALSGFVFSPFRAKDLMRGILGRDAPELDFRIYDGSGAEPANLLFDSSEALFTAAARPMYVSRQAVKVGGRAWTIDFSSRPGFEADMASSQPLLIAAGGVIVSLLLYFIVLSLARQHERVQVKADAMTAELREGEARFRQVVEAAPSAMIMIGESGHIRLVNRQAETLFGYPRAELVGLLIETLVPERFRALHPEHRRQFFSAPQTRAMGAGRDLYGLRRDGGEMPIEIGLNPIDTPQGRCVLASIIDITERQRADQALRDSEAMLMALINNTSAVIYIKHLDGRYRLINRSYEQLFNVTLDWLRGKTDYDFFPKEYADVFRANDLRVVVGEVVQAEEIAPHPDGSLHTYLSVKFPLRDSHGTVYATCGISTNVTGAKRAEEATKESLREKEALLNEIHHRVKNNLQVISSLLSLQAGQAHDPHVREVLAESQDRVKAMALIHQLLYEHKDFSRIRLREYLDRLTKLLLAGYGAQAGRVALRLEASGEEVYLDLHRAIPCGLLVTELVTNAFKHAFPAAACGEVTVALHGSVGGAARLTVRDTGVGLPEGRKLESSTSLGFQLVPLFAEQMDARFTVGDGPGAHFDLDFVVTLIQEENL